VATTDTCPLIQAGYSCHQCAAEGAPYCSQRRVPVSNYAAAFALLIFLIAIFVISLHIYFPAGR